MFNLEYDKQLVKLFQKHKGISKFEKFKNVITEIKILPFASYAKKYVKNEIYDAEFYGDITKDEAKTLNKILFS